MAHDRSQEILIGRYRRWFAKLIRLYPPAYREQMGESMRQTFNDLLRERREGDQGLFVFALWTFFGTLQAIIKENLFSMTPHTKVFMTTLAISIAAIATLAWIYVINGSEREDAWLYIYSAAIVVFGVVIAYPKKKKKD